MTHTPHYDIITPPCTIYSLASKGECPLECSSFIVLRILRSIPLSSIPYFVLRIRPLTFFPPTKAWPQLQNTFLEAYWNTSPHWSGVIPRAFSASAETWQIHDPQSCNNNVVWPVLRCLLSQGVLLQGNHGSVIEYSFWGSCCLQEKFFKEIGCQGEVSVVNWNPPPC